MDQVGKKDVNGEVLKAKHFFLLLETMGVIMNNIGKTNQFWDMITLSFSSFPFITHTSFP